MNQGENALLDSAVDVRERERLLERRVSAPPFEKILFALFRETSVIDDETGSVVLKSANGIIKDVGVNVDKRGERRRVVRDLEPFEPVRSRPNRPRVANERRRLRRSRLVLPFRPKGRFVVDQVIHRPLESRRFLFPVVIFGPIDDGARVHRLPMFGVKGVRLLRALATPRRVLAQPKVVEPVGKTLDHLEAQAVPLRPRFRTQINRGNVVRLDASANHYDRHRVAVRREPDNIALDFVANLLDALRVLRVLDLLQVVANDERRARRLPVDAVGRRAANRAVNPDRSNRRGARGGTGNRRRFDFVRLPNDSGRLPFEELSARKQRRAAESRERNGDFREIFANPLRNERLFDVGEEFRRLRFRRRNDEDVLVPTVKDRPNDRALDDRRLPGAARRRDRPQAAVKYRVLQRPNITQVVATKRFLELLRQIRPKEKREVVFAGGASASVENRRKGRDFPTGQRRSPRPFGGAPFLPFVSGGPLIARRRARPSFRPFHRRRRRFPPFFPSLPPRLFSFLPAKSGRRRTAPSTAPTLRA